jgi:hypothetical protein
VVLERPNSRSTATRLRSRSRNRSVWRAMLVNRLPPVATGNTICLPFTAPLVSNGHYWARLDFVDEQAVLDPIDGSRRSGVNEGFLPEWPIGVR